MDFRRFWETLRCAASLGVRNAALPARAWQLAEPGAQECVFIVWVAVGQTDACRPDCENLTDTEVLLPQSS